MAYPREVYLDSEIEMALKNYLDSQLENHRTERSASVEDDKISQRDYWARPGVTERTFPFRGAANVVIPIHAITTETVFARDMMTAFSLDQIVSCKVVKMYTDLDRDIERAMDHVLTNDINFRRVAENIDLERIKLGVGIGKAGYCREVREAVRTNEEGEDEIVQVPVKNGAVLEAISKPRFIMPLGYQDPQTAPWVGQEHEDSPDRIKIYEDSGLFRPGTYEKISAYYTQLSAQNTVSQGYDRKIETLTNTVPIPLPNKLQWVEVYLTFQVHKNTNTDTINPKPVSPREIVVHYHKDSGTFCSIRYNWHDDLHRPYRLGNYQPFEHRWPGIGVGKMVEQFQREITTQHRQRLDAGTLANCNMFAVNRGTGIGTNEPVFPGKIWLVENKDDIQPISLGDVKASAFNNEIQTLQYIQMRTGVNEVNTGMPQAGTPGTAAGEVGRLQESQRKHDYYYSNLRILLTQLITDTACNIAQFGFKDQRYFDYIDNGIALRNFFNQPVDLIRSGIVCQFSLVSQNQNKIIDRQNATQISGFLTQYYTGLLQMAQQLGDQNLMAAIINKFMIGATEAAKQILESYDVRDPDKILLTEITNAISRSNQLPQGQGTNPSSSGPSQTPPLLPASTSSESY